jgi:hypothetical protein
MGEIPTRRWNPTPNGNYGAPRDDGDRTHRGVDLGGDDGSPVYAPEDGELAAVVAVAAPGGSLPQPWRGYEPGVVVIKGVSGTWHVLGHLNAEDLRRRHPVMTNGELVDQAKPFRDQVERVPIIIAREGKRSIPRVKEGEQVGEVSNLRHVHWETRRTMLATGAGRVDPRLWANKYVWHGQPPDGVDVPPATTSGAVSAEDGLVLIVVALAAVELFGKKGKRR